MNWEDIPKKYGACYDIRDKVPNDAIAIDLGDVSGRVIDLSRFTELRYVRLSGILTFALPDKVLRVYGKAVLLDPSYLPATVVEITASSCIGKFHEGLIYLCIRAGWDLVSLPVSLKILNILTEEEFCYDELPDTIEELRIVCRMARIDRFPSNLKRLAIEAKTRSCCGQAPLGLKILSLSRATVRKMPKGITTLIASHGRSIHIPDGTKSATVSNFELVVFDGKIGSLSITNVRNVQSRQYSMHELRITNSNIDGLDTSSVKDSIVITDCSGKHVMCSDTLSYFKGVNLKCCDLNTGKNTKRVYLKNSIIRGQFEIPKDLDGIYMDNNEISVALLPPLPPISSVTNNKIGKLLPPRLRN